VARATTSSWAARGLESRPELAKIAHELVEGIRTDLTVDGADREATEARIRAKIKRLPRTHKYRPPKRRTDGGGGGADSIAFGDVAQLVLDQAKALYCYWPDVATWERGCSPDLHAAANTIVTRVWTPQRDLQANPGRRLPRPPQRLLLKKVTGS
jgi:Domain of unknown function (DUF3387)